MIWGNLGPGCRTDMEPAPSGPRRWELVAKPGTQVLPWMEVGDSYPVAPKRLDREMCSSISEKPAPSPASLVRSRVRVWSSAM